MRFENANQSEIIALEILEGDEGEGQQRYSLSHLL